jgi:hypothetical protein
MPDLEFPDLYADGLQVASGPYGLTMTFYLSDPDNPGPAGRRIGRVRVSTTLGEALADILKQSIAEPAAKPGGEADADHQ